MRRGACRGGDPGRAGGPPVLPPPAGDVVRPVVPPAPRGPRGGVPPAPGSTGPRAPADDDETPHGHADLAARGPRGDDAAEAPTAVTEEAPVG